MARVGGYVLVDATGIDEDAIKEASTTGVTVPGIFAKVHAAALTGKPIIFENVINGDNAYAPFDVSLYGDSLAYTVALGLITVQIAADDKVTQLSNDG